MRRPGRDRDGTSPPDGFARVVNTTRGTSLASEAGFALSRSARRRGLTGRMSMEPGEALVFPRCRQVHSFGMLIPIDVLFLDRHGTVLRVCPDLPPRRVSPVTWRARAAIELPAGTLARTGTGERDRVVVIEPGQACMRG